MSPRTLRPLVRWEPFVLVASMVGHASVAWSQSSPTSLQWVRLPGAESCADGATLARLVEQRLGRAAFVAPSRAERTLEGRIAPRREGVGWEVSIATYTPAGRAGLRTLVTERADCAAATPTLGLVLSLLTDPDACRDDACQGALRSGEATAPAVLRLLAESAPTPRPPPSTPERPSTLFVGAGLSLLGVSPSVSASVAWRWRARATPWALELGLAGLWPIDLAVSSQSSLRAHAAGALASALGCYGLFDDQRVSLCAGVAGGAMVTRVEGSDASTPAVDPVVAAVLRLSVEVPLGARWVLRASASAAAPVAWPRYQVTVDGAEPVTVQRAGPVGGSLEMHLGWRFGT